MPSKPANRKPRFEPKAACYVAKLFYMCLENFPPIGKKIHKNEIQKINAAKISLGSRIRT